MHALNYSYTGVAPLSPTSGSGSLPFVGLVWVDDGFGDLQQTGRWLSGTFAGSCTIDAKCDVWGTGQFTPVLTIGGTPTTLTLQSSTCDPFSVTWTVPNPSAAYTAGFRTLTISDSAPTTPCPCPYNKIRVLGCGAGLAGATVTVKDGAGTVLDSGTTDSLGDFASSVTGGPFSITVSKSRFVTTTFTNKFICNNPPSSNTLDMSVHVASGYTCLASRPCGDPIKNTLTATHSFFGTTTATISGGSWLFVWTYTTPGAESCAVDTLPVSVQFDDSMHPTGPLNWKTCDASQTLCLPAGCPSSFGINTGGDGTFASPATFSQTSFSCPVSFSWSGSVTFSIATPSDQHKLYNMLGSQTFTLNITE